MQALSVKMCCSHALTTLSSGSLVFVQLLQGQISKCLIHGLAAAVVEFRELGYGFLYCGSRIVDSAPSLRRRSDSMENTLLSQVALLKIVETQCKNAQ